MIIGKKKTDPGGHRFDICIFYRFPQKSCNVHCFMHNKWTGKVYIFLGFNASES